MSVAFPATLQQDLVRFEVALQQFAKSLGLDLAQFEADHISLRCNQNTTAEMWKTQLSRIATLISENEVNGRPICLFLLHEKIALGPWQIECIELPWPGKKFYPREGWEHVELVLGGDPLTLHQRALACLPDTVLTSPYVRLKFSQPGAEQERLPNPTLAITQDEVTIKFHPYSIRDVVASEQQ